MRKDEGFNTVNGIYSGGQVLVKSLYIGATGKAVLPMYSRSSRNGGGRFSKTLHARYAYDMMAFCVIQSQLITTIRWPLVYPTEVVHAVLLEIHNKKTSS